MGPKCMYVVYRDNSFNLSIEYSTFNLVGSIHIMKGLYKVFIQQKLYKILSCIIELINKFAKKGDNGIAAPSIY